MKAYRSAIAATISLALFSGATYAQLNEEVEPEVIDVFLIPHVINLSDGESKALRTTIAYSDGTFKSFVTEGVEWSSSNSSIAPISKEGIVYGVNSGTAKLYAEYEGFTSTTPSTVTVGDAAILGVSISMEDTNIPLGGKQPIIAMGEFSDGTTQDITDLVDWSYASNENAFTVSNGWVHGINEGWGMLLARFEGQSSESIQVEVAPFGYKDLVAFPQQQTINVDDKLVPQVLGVTQDDETVIIDRSELSYEIVDASVAVDAGDGSIKALKKGTTHVYPIAESTKASIPLILTVR